MIIVKKKSKYYFMFWGLIVYKIVFKWYIRDCFSSYF